MPLKAINNKIKAGGLALGVKRVFLKYKIFCLFVIVPNAIFLFYMMLWQTHSFEVYAEIIIKDNTKSTNLGMLAPFISGAGESAQELEIITRFIDSYGMLEILDKKFSLKEYYSKNENIDIISRYHGSNMEDFLKYFRGKIKIITDVENRIMRLYFNDFSPTKSHEILTEVLLLSENFINGINERLSEKQAILIKRAADEIGEKIKVAQAVIAKKQLKYNVASPRREFEQLNVTVATLESELIKQRTILAEMQSYLNPNSLQVVLAKQKITNVEKRLSAMKTTVLKKDNIGGNSLTIDFGELEIEMDLLIKEYQFALSALEQAKLATLHNAKHIVIITEPYIPDYTMYPRVVYNMLLSLFISIGIYVILKALFSIIKQHENY